MSQLTQTESIICYPYLHKHVPFSSLISPSQVKQKLLEEHDKQPTPEHYIHSELTTVKLTAHLVQRLSAEQDKQFKILHSTHRLEF